MSSPSSPQPPGQGPGPDEIIRAANAALDDHRNEITLELMRHVLAQGGDIGARWRDVAELSGRIGDVFAAVEAQRRYVAGHPQDAEGRAALAGYMLRTGQLDEALEVVEALRREHPDSANFASLHAMIHLYQGDMDAARTLFLQTLALDSDDVESRRQLVKLDGFDSGETAVSEMEALSERRRAADRPLQFSALQFALGEYHEKGGERDRAATHYDQAQDSMAAIRPYPVEDEGRFTDRITEVFNAEFFANLRQAGAGADSARPIFVMTLPRSGSTLVERLLTRHSAVTGGGELEAMRLANYPLGHYEPESLERFAGRQGRGGASGGPFGDIGGRYLQFITEQFGDEGRVVDKALEMPFLAGTALAALPNASFVWLSRDPRDIALSVYKTPFPQRHDWSWSWDRIAHHIVHVEKLKRHFLSIFQEQILDLHYEDLVTSPDDQTACLLSHCGLPPEPVQADFHQSAQAVMTPSMMEVRKPISARRVGGWKPWGDFLQPFTRTFEKIWPDEWGDPYRSD